MLDESQILQNLLAWRPRLAAAAWVVVRDAHAAEDLFQNVVLKALTRDGLRFESPASLMSWALVTIRRESLDWIKLASRQASRLHTLDGTVVELFDAEWQRRMNNPADRRLELLQICLDTLPGESRRLLELRYFEGLDCTSVGRELGLGLQVVYKRLSRLHEALRECVERRLRGGTVSEGGLG